VAGTANSISSPKATAHASLPHNDIIVSPSLLASLAPGFLSFVFGRSEPGTRSAVHRRHSYRPVYRSVCAEVALEQATSQKTLF
jgi:hypothetical protein